MARPLNITDKKISYSSIDDKDVIQFIRTIRNGISFVQFYSFARNAPFTMVEWAIFLNMSPRTMQRHQAEKKSFSSIYSERILQITLLYNLGTEVFGEKEKFHTWLDTQNLAMGGIKPKELLDNSFGIGMVKDELTRIEHGVLA